MKLSCPACGFETADQAKFCTQCGAALENRCPSCGFENPLSAKFCGGCGVALRSQAKGAVAEPARRGEAERRRLTVMFCDLVGSTSHAERLDPEDWRQVVRAYQETCATIIARFQGQIAQYLGDGLLIYFGYPVAHEDDAARAVRAGLSVVAELPQLNCRLREMVPALNPSSLQTRLGLHTGWVVVGEMGGGREPMAAVGDTPNIAARVQELAEPDTVVVSAATHRLTVGFFECRDLGPRVLKGVATPMQMFQVLGESGVRSRLEAAVCQGLTPLVGREHEIGFLFERWEEAKDGVAQVVLLSGEAGIGKSRLLQVFKDRVQPEPQAWLECQCSPYHQNSALYPLIDQWQRALAWSRDDSVEQRLAKLEGTLAKHQIPRAEGVPLLASLLSLALPEGRYAPLALDPQRQRQLTLEALRTWLRKLSARQPLIFLMEDLHWADASTLEFLALVVDEEPAVRMLTLLTFRPDFSPPWGARSHQTLFILNPLLRKQTEAMVKNVVRDNALPPEVLQQLVTKTDGIPLFVEELTKMVLESGLVQPPDRYSERTRPLAPLAIPATLHDSLIARLDHLTTAKEVASLGAMLGREFTYEMLRAIASLEETTLQKELSRLVEAGLLYQRGSGSNATYTFKHALIQEAAYQSLLKSKRLQFHRRIAEVLEQKFGEIAQTQPELLAHHYTEAGVNARAIPCWQRAGERAVERSANLEAIHHLSKGLEVLQTLPDSLERAEKELDLLATLGPALLPTKGYAAPEVQRTYARARELCRQIGETPRLFQVLWGLYYFYALRAEFQTAQELAEQLFGLAKRANDRVLLMQSHQALSGVFVHRGELSAAKTHLEQARDLYDPAQARTNAFTYGLDAGVYSRSYAARTLWLLGYPDQALQSSREGLAIAKELGHASSLASALGWAASVHQFRRERQPAQELAEALIALSIEFGLAFSRGSATVARGWALAEGGQREEGIAQIREGWAAWRATGAEVDWPYYATLLAEIYGKGGQAKEGLVLLADALAAVAQNGDAYWEAEMHRVKGELLLLQTAGGDRSDSVSTDEAEACFRQALDVSRRQQAKSLELRAAMSLSRLWQQQGKNLEARAMLTDLYGWFTEGFDTADLKEAKALLEQLV